MNTNNIKNIDQAKKNFPELFRLSENVIELKNGDVAISRYEKYQPYLTFIVSAETADITPLVGNNFPALNLSFDCSSKEAMIGEYFVNKKGTKCFRPKPDGKFILISSYWGGCFESSRGYEYEELKPIAIYAKRRSSNGGGCGVNFYIFPRDFRREVDIDDI